MGIWPTLKSRPAKTATISFWVSTWSHSVHPGVLILACAMLPCLGSAELGRAMWDRLLAAKTEPEARLCKVTLGALADAEIQRAFTEDVKRAVSPPPPRSRASRWPNNATGRRQEARRAARAPEQGVPIYVRRMYVMRPLWKWLQALKKRRSTWTNR